ncbi:hypothetical protein [Bifidobacterium pseudolongum]|uniref:ATP-dependent serine Clp protease n=1 Tax=Bifidobacterium pseudolongum subsp. globosum TaxID=1690 RepID=A0A2N3QVW5_9BIFI|nr:hypothetical protein [Bifidobacterium pseudolongum]PKU96214.1 ATP-dependent serine Clp protease [Bifidobacterium pseudolongum subsp. globosum]
MSDNQPTLAEFEAWDADAEADAIGEVAQRSHVRHIIKNGEYWALTPDGNTYKLPIDLSVDDFKRLSDADSDAESIDGIISIITAFAGKEQAKKLAAQPVTVVAYLLQDYAAILAKIQGADLGK